MAPGMLLAVAGVAVVTSGLGRTSSHTSSFPPASPIDCTDREALLAQVDQAWLASALSGGRAASA